MPPPDPPTPPATPESTIGEVISCRPFRTAALQALQEPIPTREDDAAEAWSRPPSGRVPGPTVLPVLSASGVVTTPNGLPAAAAARRSAHLVLAALIGLASGKLAGRSGRPLRARAGAAQLVKVKE